VKRDQWFCFFYERFSLIFSFCRRVDPPLEWRTRRPGASAAPIGPGAARLGPGPDHVGAASPERRPAETRRQGQQRKDHLPNLQSDFFFFELSIDRFDGFWGFPFTRRSSGSSPATFWWSYCPPYSKTRTHRRTLGAPSFSLESIKKT